MDEDEFRKTYAEMREYPCAFSKSILNRACNCRKAQRLSLGEREGLTCTEWTAHKTCHDVLEQVRSNARFVVKATTIPGPLPHAKELRVQVGGLNGLQQVLFPEREGAPVSDICALIQAAIEAYGRAEALPFQRMIPAIAAFQGRRRPERH